MKRYGKFEARFVISIFLGAILAIAMITLIPEKFRGDGLWLACTILSLLGMLYHKIWNIADNGWAGVAAVLMGPIMVWTVWVTYPLMEKIWHVTPDE